MPQLRLLTADDTFARRQLMSHAFGRGAQVDPPTEPQEPAKESIGIFDGSELLSCLTTCPFTVYWPGALNGELAMGGIAGVATYADARGGGHVDRLLRESLVRMRDAGQVVSALYPFAWAFYQRYGWDAVGEKRNVTLPLRELPGLGRRAKRLSDEAAATQVPALYGIEAARYRGAFTTETRSWPGPLEHSDKRTTYPYATEGGYLLWRFGDMGEIREYMASTPDAEAALLHLLRDLGMQTKQGKVTLPTDETITARFSHWDIETQVEPVFSGRVVDVKAALESLQSTAPNGELALQIQDATAPWNQGTWLVTVEAGAVSCLPTDRAPQLSLEIKAFSQAFWGAPDLARLRRAGRVTVATEEAEAFSLLSQVLPPRPVMCWNHF